MLQDVGTTRTARDRSPARLSEFQRARQWLHFPIGEFAAGIIVASLSLPLCIAAGVLAYGPLGPDLSGIAATAGILCAVTGGLAASCVRRSSFIATIPTTPISIIQASFVGSALTAMAGDRSLALLAMPAFVLLTGAWQLLFVASGFARVVKFVPHPVVVGFVAGIALLIAINQVPTFLGVGGLHDVGNMNVGEIVQRFPVLIFAAAIVGGILFLRRKAPGVPGLLAALLVGSFVYHLAHVVDPRMELGSTVGHVSSLLQETRDRLELSRWRELLGNFSLLRAELVGSFTLAIVGTLDTFFAMQTAQRLGDVWLDPRREITGQAIGNVFSALTGGLAVSTSLSVTAANFEAGGRTRISTVISALLLLAVAVSLPRLISLLPLAVLSAILVASSFRLVDWHSLQKTAAGVVGRNVRVRQEAQRDALTIISVLLAVIVGEPVIGVLVGVVLSCLLFLIDLSRPVVAAHSDASHRRSKRLRSAREHDFLREHGRSIKIFELQGVLFFGNAYNLAEQIRISREEAEIVILNCRRVANIDNSGLGVFSDIAARLRKEDKCLVLSGQNGSYDQVGSRKADADWLYFPNLDQALEWAENRILDRCLGDSRSDHIRLEDTELAREITNAELSALYARVTVTQYQKGTRLCRKGELSDRLWIVTSGTVSIRLDGANATMRLASLGPGCTVGEMGLLTGQPRSADAYADDDVTAYLLTEENFKDILHKEPKLGERLLINIARQLAQRLYDASEELRLVSSA